MSEEFSAGVQILLKRMESNPDEFKEEHGRWSSIRNAVFNYKENGEKSAWLRGLTKAEIDAMYEKLSALYRAVMDEWVMKNVLAEPSEEEQRLNAYQMAQGKRAQGFGWNDPRMLANVTVGGSGGGGSGATTCATTCATTMVTSDTSILSRLKKELGIK